MEKEKIENRETPNKDKEEDGFLSEEDLSEEEQEKIKERLRIQGYI